MVFLITYHQLNIPIRPIAEIMKCSILLIYICIHSRDRDRKVVEFTTTYAICAYVLDTLCDKVCQ